MRHYTIFGIILLVIAAVCAAYWFFAQTSTVAFDLPVAAQVAPISSTTPAAPRTPPAGYAEYRGGAYNFSLFYPSELSVKTYDEGGGAMTFDFQNAQKGEGFQIFIVPYSGTQISTQRFKEDEPSGVRKSPTYGLIDGASAAAFYSTDAQLGDTYEVWFIHGGYLYELTTLKPLDTWLQGVMQSWAFI